MLLLLVNAILVGFVIGLISLILSDRKAFKAREKAFDDVCTHLLDVRKDMTTAFKYIRQQNSNHNKILGLIERARQGIKQGFVNMDRDIEHLFMLQKATNQAIKDGVIAHNDLTDVVLDNLRDVWCELSCDDCDDCPYADKCEASSEAQLENDLDEDENTSPVNKVILRNLDGSIACPNPNIFKHTSNQGTMTITPSDDGEEKIEVLRNKMKSSGVPENIIDQFVDKVEKIIQSNANMPITLVWDSLIPEDKQPQVEKKIKEKTNKMVDPNSKIVKTLNRTFEQSPNE